MFREKEGSMNSIEFNFYVELANVIQMENLYDENQGIRQSTALAFDALTVAVIEFDVYQVK